MLAPDFTASEQEVVVENCALEFSLCWMFVHASVHLSRVGW